LPAEASAKAGERDALRLARRGKVGRAEARPARIIVRPAKASGVQERLGVPYVNKQTGL
jgi:hypothetical protein